MNDTKPRKTLTSQVPPSASAETVNSNKTSAAGWRGHLAEMSPAYFGLVMATGIISLGCQLMGWPLLGNALLMLNLVQYAVLCVLYALRAVLMPRRFFGDLTNHLKGPGYFTIVAGSSVLACQLIIQLHRPHLALFFGGLALLLWLLLTYTIFAAFTVKQNKPPLEQGISGSWLLAVVATQSLAVTSTLLATGLGQPFQREFNLLALSMWLWGGMLYIWIMSLIFYRYTFFRFSPEELSPPYWINMGAMAISTLAGSRLILNAAHAPFLDSLLPFLKGFTIFYWATGTWWIPMLLILGVWRYIVQRFPLRYDPLYWGAVFPLGMYAVSLWQMDRAMDFGFFVGLADGVLLIALLAWATAFAGMLHHILQCLRASAS